MSFIAYVLRTNLSFAAPEMMADLGLSELQWGWVMAAFTAGYTIFQFPGGLLGDRMCRTGGLRWSAPTAPSNRRGV